MGGADPLTHRLGYLLKHAYLRLDQGSAQALAPLGVDGHELAVLAVLATENPLSQAEAAQRLGVDRTTMVALVDSLEDRGLVARRRSAQDRRKNIVEPTPAGLDCLQQGEQARRELEQRFLAPLSEAEAAALLRALRTLVTADRA